MTIENGLVGTGLCETTFTVYAPTHVHRSHRNNNFSARIRPVSASHLRLKNSVNQH